MHGLLGQEDVADVIGDVGFGSKMLEGSIDILVVDRERVRNHT